MKRLLFLVIGLHATDAPRPSNIMPSPHYKHKHHHKSPTMNQEVTINCDTQNHNHHAEVQLEAAKNRNTKIKAACLVGCMTLVASGVAGGISLALYYGNK